MSRRIWLGALAGAFAGLLGWLVAIPFLPVKAMSAATTLTEALNAAAHSSTLGTFFGWFGSLMFGAFAGLFISLVYAHVRNPLERARTVVVATLLGGILVCATDAASEWIVVEMLSSKGAIAIVGLAISYLLKALLLSTGLCTALIVAMGVRPGVFVRLPATIGLATVLALVSRAIVEVASAFVIAPMLLNKATVNSWVVAAPAFLASNLAMGAAVGACIGMAEALTRSAWLHLALTYGEGYTWTLDWPIARIGHAEGVEIRVEEMSGFAPVHAQIQRHGSDFAIQDLGFGTRLNGHQIPAAWLADNDVITLGPYEFIFHLRRPVTRRSHDLPPGAIIVSAEATSEGTRGAEPMRLEDDFGNSFPLAEQTSIVGRDAACEVTITWDGTVSRKHAEIVIGRNGAMIRDLGSSNGTRLNGRVIQSVKVPIKDGDVLEFGTARLTFRE